MVHTDQIVLSRSLAQIVEDIPLITEFKQMQLQSPATDVLKEMFNELGFGRGLNAKLDQYHNVFHGLDHSDL